MPESATPATLLRRPEVQRRTGLSVSSLYRQIHAGEFPPPVKIGIRSVAWPESAVMEWIASRTRQAA